MINGILNWVYSCDATNVTRLNECFANSREPCVSLLTRSDEIIGVSPLKATEVLFVKP